MFSPAPSPWQQTPSRATNRWRPGRRVLLGGQLGPLWLGERLGQGASGQLFVVTGAALRGFWAIKRVDDAAQARREHALMRRAQGAQVLRVGPRAALGAEACFLLEYAPAGAVDQVLLNSRLMGRPVPLGDRLRWWQQLVEAVAGVHRAGIVHGDIAWKNVMLVETPGGELTAKLGDFGTASLGPSSEARGTLIVAAPEILAGLPQSMATDIFALGCCLYAAVVGIEPFYDDDERVVAAALRAQQRSVTPADFVSILRLEGLCAARATALSRLVESMLAATAARRPSAAEVAQTLRALV